MTLIQQLLVCWRPETRQSTRYKAYCNQKKLKISASGQPEPLATSRWPSETTNERQTATRNASTATSLATLDEIAICPIDDTSQALARHPSYLEINSHTHLCPTHKTHHTCLLLKTPHETKAEEEIGCEHKTEHTKQPRTTSQTPSRSRQGRWEKHAWLGKNLYKNQLQALGSLTLAHLDTCATIVAYSKTPTQKA